ncbi:uncharacterized protein LOC113291710 [Papaver somniferum]|uniref:uncharacterized protein LOC113291710 n=1 Tax=Papaver somniferum TaxID=3469 RepID=UPI000E703F97|nr:uncharacterized protein LOC113291710 [Papaver somniferum]
MSQIIIHKSTDTTKGNIWLYRHSSLSNPVVVSTSKKSITVKVGDVMVTGIHAACLTVDRRQLWEELKDISAMNLPWMIIGDFNVVLSCDEKFGGRRPLRVSMQDFRDYKAFYNIQWLDKFGGWSYKVGVRGISDHGAIFGAVVNSTKPENSLFRYQSIWSSHPEFLTLIKESWNEVIAGNPAFSFMAKLKRLKQIIKKWNWEVFGDLRIKVKVTEDEVLQASLLSDNDPENIELLNNLVTTRGKHDMVSQQYNELMRAKYRVKWVKEGGANIIFFHTSIKIRQSQNNITKLEDDDGNMATKLAQIANVLVEHYKRKFKAQNASISEDILDVIPKILTEEDNYFLDVVPSTMKIKEAVYGMDANNAPGPDGFPGSFYKFAWEIIGSELIEAIQFC